jgi:ferredoxin-NADP reductase
MVGMVETAETGLTVGMVQTEAAPITPLAVQVAQEEQLRINPGNFIFLGLTSNVILVSRTHYARGNAL